MTPALPPLAEPVALPALHHDRGAVELLDHLRSHGCCRLRGTLPTHLDDHALRGAIRLFSLPQGTKLSCRAPEPDTAGFSPYGVAHALDTAIPNLLESWNVAAEADTPLPSGHESLHEILVTMARQLRDVAGVVLEALDRVLGADGALAQSFTPRDCSLFLLHYPRSLVGRDPRATRQSLHVDSSIITLSPRATDDGLQVATPEGLVKMALDPGDLLILAGSLLEYLTDGDIPGCRHTVETPEVAWATDRTSMVYFATADPAATLRPLSHASSATRTGRALQIDLHDRSYAERVYGGPPASGRVAPQPR